MCVCAHILAKKLSDDLYFGDFGDTTLSTLLQSLVCVTMHPCIYEENSILIGKCCIFFLKIFTVSSRIMYKLNISIIKNKLKISRCWECYEFKAFKATRSLNSSKDKKKINHSIKPESVLEKGFLATSVQLTTTAVLWLMLSWCSCKLLILYSNKYIQLLTP